MTPKKKTNKKQPPHDLPAPPVVADGGNARPPPLPLPALCPPGAKEDAKKKRVSFSNSLRVIIFEHHTHPT